jgi:hypothetical protein
MHVGLLVCLDHQNTKPKGKVTGPAMLKYMYCGAGLCSEHADCLGHMLSHLPADFHDPAQ